VSEAQRPLDEEPAAPLDEEPAAPLEEPEPPATPESVAPLRHGMPCASLPSLQVELLAAGFLRAEEEDDGVAGVAAVAGEADAVVALVPAVGEAGLAFALVLRSESAADRADDPLVDIEVFGLVVVGLTLFAGAVAAGGVVVLAFSFLRSPMASALALPMAKMEIRNTGASLRIWGLLGLV
jgi:hypothetical protein